MKLPSQATLIQWATFVTLLLVLIPCQIFLQISHYAELEISPDMKRLFQIISSAICVIEAFALPLMLQAVKRKEPVKTAVFAVLAFVPMILFTLLADVGAVGAQLSRDQAMRDAHRQEQANIVLAISEADATITALKAAIPEAYVGRPASSLEAEINGLDRRLAAYADPPQSLLRTRTLLDSALATRTTLDKTVKDRDALRANQKPPVRENHAQVDTIIALAGMFGISPTADMVRAFLPLFYALTLKLVLICGFLLVTPNTSPPQAPPGPPPLKVHPPQAAPVQMAAPGMIAPGPLTAASPIAPPIPVVTPPPLMTAGPQPAPAAQPSTAGPVPAPTPGANAKIAGILQRGLPRKPKKSPV